MSNKIMNTFEKMTSHDFGKGQIYSVAYDTAWLARVPKKNQLNEPAYPQAIAWLLNHKNTDGSWGNEYPFNAYSNILNTLAAILALKQWPKYQNGFVIDHSLTALDALIDKVNSNEYETIAFELLLPALYDEAENLQLPLSKKFIAFCQSYESKRSEKMALLTKLHQAHGWHKPSSWWFSLEMLGASKAFKFSLDDIQHMLAKQPSVAASPAATAYYLRIMRTNGLDAPKAESYLNAIVKSQCNRDSLPNICPIDTFELAFSGKYFFEAGLTPNDSGLLKTIIQKLHTHWQNNKNSGLGYSSHFFPDPDDTACAIMTLSAAGITNLDIGVIKQAFNGEFIETFPAERFAGASPNIHSLQALRMVPANADTRIIIPKIVQWLEQHAKQNNQQGLMFHDKWHYSDIYPTARGVIALKGLHDELGQQCVDWLLAHQHQDGGWGKQGVSNPEETGFASLALANWQKHKNNVPTCALKNAQHYLANAETLHKIPLWIGKVLYCPRLVTASASTAGKIALERLTHRRPAALNKQQSLDEFGTIELTLNKKLLNGHKIQLPCAAPHYHFSDKLVIDKVKQYGCQLGKQLGLNPKKCEALMSDLAIACIKASQINHVKELEIFTEFSLLVLAIDDVLDTQWQHIDNTKDVFQDLLTMFKLGKANQTKPSKHILPDLAIFYKAYKHFFEKISNKTNDHTEFLNSLERNFHYLEKEFDYRQHNKMLGLNDYLDLRMIAGGTEASCELAFMLNGLTLDKAIRTDKHFKAYAECAYRSLILANDLLSLDKESTNQHANDNAIFLLKQNNVELTDAVELCINEYKNNIYDMLKLRRRLLHQTSSKNKTTLTKALDIIGQHVQSHLDWAAVTSRYH